MAEADRSAVGSTIRRAIPDAHGPGALGLDGKLPACSNPREERRPVADGFLARTGVLSGLSEPGHSHHAAGARQIRHRPGILKPQTGVSPLSPLAVERVSLTASGEKALNAVGVESRVFSASCGVAAEK